MPEELKVSWICFSSLTSSSNSNVAIDDLDLVHRLSGGKVDLTYGR
jgi:hypothetical protein